MYNPHPSPPSLPPGISINRLDEEELLKSSAISENNEVSPKMQSRNLFKMKDIQDFDDLYDEYEDYTSSNEPKFLPKNVEKLYFSKKNDYDDYDKLYSEIADKYEKKEEFGQIDNYLKEDEEEELKSQSDMTEMSDFQAVFGDSLKCPIHYLIVLEINSAFVRNLLTRNTKVTLILL